MRSPTASCSEPRLSLLDALRVRGDVVRPACVQDPENHERRGHKDEDGHGHPQQLRHGTGFVSPLMTASWISGLSGSWSVPDSGGSMR